MKTFFIITIAVLGLNALSELSAQPSITYNNHAPFIGLTATNMNLSSTGEPLTINPGPAGANQTWNFSQLTGNEQYVDSYVDPASTPFASEVGGTDINLALAWEEEDEAGFVFLHLNPAELRMRAMGFTEFDEPISFAFWQPSPAAMIFPIAYENTFSTHGEIILDDPMGFTLVIKTWMDAQADAWGALTTPVATYNSTLRVKSTSIDSTLMYLDGNLFFALGSNSIDYSWFSPTTRSMVYSISGEFDGMFMPYDLSYLMSETVGIAAPVSEPLHVYPNPATERIYVQLPAGGADYMMKLSDMSGRLVYERKVTSGNGTESFDLGAMPKGIFLLQVLRNSAVIASQKVVIK